MCSTPIFAAPLDYHATAPSDDVRPYVTDVSRNAMPASKLWPLIRKHIKYVFVIYQENRSFDSYFGTFPGADGLYSRAASETPGFTETLTDPDGTAATIHPFRIGPDQFAADTDDVDHSHSGIDAKMDILGGTPLMDHFAAVEQQIALQRGQPVLPAKQFGELTMAHEDCDTVPILWRYADRFVLFDHVFQLMTGPSTLGNISIIAAQTGQTQWVLHPGQAYKGNGEKGPGVPVVNDADPFWGSQLDKSASKLPVNPKDFKGDPPTEYDTQENLTFASLPLTLEGQRLGSTVASDSDPDGDLSDVRHDVAAIAKKGQKPVAFGWYEEGYDREPTDLGPTDAAGRHASYITHHNGPQYFGYIANNDKMRANLHGLEDFFDAIANHALPYSGGVFYVKGGYQNTLGLKPADSDPAVQKAFKGDDDHPAYSDAQISEAMVAEAINAIATSPYWDESAIIITWDDSEGDYDHLPPPVRSKGPDGSVITDGPRVPLLVISPYARVHYVSHESGNHASVVKFVDGVFNLTPLAKLPDEARARKLGKAKYGQDDLGPADVLTPDVGDLSSAFDPERLSGRAAPLPNYYAMVPESFIRTVPPGLDCKALGIVPVDVLLGITNEIPADFNPRPKTNPTK
jgi:phospholipase C